MTPSSKDLALLYHKSSREANAPLFDNPFRSIIMRANSNMQAPNMDEQRTLTLEDILAFLPADDVQARQTLQRAYEIAEEIHRDQFRDSGEPYIQHPLNVAYLLAEGGYNLAMITAGLLHDVLEDTRQRSPDSLREQLLQEFGKEVLTFVEGVTKLNRIEAHASSDSERYRDAQELESLRKMFIIMAENDLGVIFIKLADRLHNMRTLDGLQADPERQRRIARETMQIFVPLANRIGIWAWKAELEDRAFRYLNPALYQHLVQLLEARREEREAGVQQHIQQLRDALAAQGILADIKGRPKHIYSIHRKMRRKNVPFSQIYDTEGIRVIVSTVPECYQALGIVHGLWIPIESEFDDYIAKPKPNGYQSLHTAVRVGNNKTLEVQIRTREMDETAERGIATAHWLYKESGVHISPQMREYINQLRQNIQEVTHDAEDAKTMLEEMQADLFEERVYVFTPKGKVIDLPLKATPIDFAYHVHTDVGNHCRGARVNGRWVPLNYQLQTGDEVEILTSRTSTPNRDWLSEELGYTQSPRARQKIRQWFRQQSREENITRGRILIEQEIRRLGLGLTLEDIAALFSKHYQRLEDFLVAVGTGDISNERILNRIEEYLKQQEKPILEAPEVEEQEPPTRPQIEAPMNIHGAGTLFTRIARCCNPLPGEEVIGYVTRGHGVTIHRRDCPNVSRLEREERERLIELEWGVEKESAFPVQIRITAYDRSRLLHDISTVITSEDLNMLKVNTGKRDRYNVLPIFITLEIPNLAKLNRVINKLAQIHNVIAVERYV